MGNLKPNYQVTDRDIEILRFINDFGFCEITHICKAFGLSRLRAYQIMKRLVVLDFVIHQRIFYGKRGIYSLSKLGASQTQLSELKKIPLAHYDHYLKVIDVYLHLLKCYPDSEWISERHVLKKQFSRGLGQKGHIEDGVLILDGKQIAIEVELSKKGGYRVEKIVRSYASRFEIHAVWYFCSDHVRPALDALTPKYTYLKVHSIKDIDHEPKNSTSS